MIKQTVLVFALLLNYKDTLWSVPFETSLGTEMALMHILFSFQNLYALQPNQRVLPDPIQQQQNSSYQNYFLQADFSLSAELHLETVWPFNRYSLLIFAAAEQFQNWPYTFGECGPESRTFL
jgi:iron complex outermembrane receptor protein